MNEKLQQTLSLLQELNQQSSLIESSETFDKIADLFENFQSNLEILSEEDTELLMQITALYQKVISRGNEEKKAFSKEIARINQSGKKAKTYIPLEELSGIELEY
ncbi:hypothetical protein [Enterococcus columbae]|uniref:Uncharacterized protein n=1 Tax=Enterococcus columbae DSM 7374 = ATCC 51263 TaxID=1121865 RepID=S0KL89_9ENTE|nr:hypothetical protein [Enterococcus columbae]EOT39971.1 hypothetical protein OMW_01760 [Enterococcus columbae DSM 7374 = ATCC 51263]EOW83956.1 hypothetical protein I568_01403 [Enterococcus columbae DSM 7374 = ATCC 51263]OJG25825.1 hypothetical protein RR47_GL001331 [Enterococcus columbae DSM 7374 = ATCC 51263]